ncbi:MAG: hypothetical protein JNL40_07525 [Cyclobacteriaceae bacterium]|nr:hypothetical protein [Cyclobacteriaceae bacterium]
MMHVSLILPAVLCVCPGFAQTVHLQAHAHNDYEHTRPFYDAYENGFRSFEADIHLVGGELHVSHHRPKPSTARTLQALYLKPLDSLRRNADHEEQMILLVDIKTEARATLKKLVETLTTYPGLFRTEKSPPFVQFILSGNRDYSLILATPGLCIDGRPGDLDKGYSADQVPLISDRYDNWMRWSGKGNPDEAELQKLRTLAKRVHAENKKLRLWAIPDREEAWGVLLDAGVDFINTDRLEALNRYLNIRK